MREREDGSGEPSFLFYAFFVVTGRPLHIPVYS